MLKRLSPEVQASGSQRRMALNPSMRKVNINHFKEEVIMRKLSNRPTQIASLSVALVSLMIWLSMSAILSGRTGAYTYASDGWYSNPALYGSSIDSVQQSKKRLSVTGQTSPIDPTETVNTSAVASNLVGCDPFKVAVFDQENIDTAQSLAEVLNTDPQIQAMAVSQSTVESGGLTGFNALIVRMYDTVTNGMAQAIRSFVADGGGYVGEWWGAGVALAGLGSPTNFNYLAPSQFLGFFAGLASDGFFVQTGNPITITAIHPVVQGIPSVFSSGDGTEFFVRAIPPFDPNLTVLATYNGYGGTNPAIMVGSSGGANVVLLFFDAIDNPGDPNLKQLWINSAKFACGGLQFDLCIQDDSNGNILQLNSTTSDYQFTRGSGGLVLGGTGKVTKKGNLITLQHTAADRRVSAQIDTGTKKATASVQVFSQGTTFTITDRNTSNNTCSCP